MCLRLVGFEVVILIRCVGAGGFMFHAAFV